MLHALSALVARRRIDGFQMQVPGTKQAIRPADLGAWLAGLQRRVDSFPSSSHWRG